MSENDHWNDSIIKSIEETSLHESCEDKAALSKIQILLDYATLSSQDVWITNAGATVHNTPYAKELIATKKPDTNNRITAENGQKMISTLIGSICSTITNKYGH